jgi:DNA topoisomerase I
VDRNEKEAQGRDFAAATGLRYVHDDKPGFTRHGKTTKTFTFKDTNGRAIKDATTVQRIRKLGIPPAWKDVWICPHAGGHIQATGIDARGRKQYRYHPDWRVARDETKFHRTIAFGKALPMIRKKTAAHLRLKGLPREKVLALLVQLLEKTLIRVGNEEYARENNSYGLTTMLDDHVTFDKGVVTFSFRGKSGVDHSILLRDARLAKVIKECQDLPQQELFAYKDDDGEQVDVKSNDVNDYLKEISGQNFTAKDFRTWNATVLAAKALQEIKKFDTKAQAKKNVIHAVEQVAKRLGNTRSVCKKSYIHPAVLEAYLDGSLLDTLEQRARTEMKKLHSMTPEEAAVLAFLQEWIRRERTKRKTGAKNGKKAVRV